MQNGTILWETELNTWNASTSISIDSAGNLFVPNFVSTSKNTVVMALYVVGDNGVVKQ